VDGVRIWSSGCLLLCPGCPFDGIQSNLGEWSCAIGVLLMGLRVEICFFYNSKYLVFPFYDSFFAAGTFELKF
jgi:hypothetical protein